MTSIDVVVMPPRDDEGLIGRGVPSLEDFRKRAPELTDSIREVAALIQAGLEADDRPKRSRAWSMDSVSLSFELGLEAEAGIVIAKGTTSATFSVQIDLTRSASPQP